MSWIDSVSFRLKLPVIVYGILPLILCGVSVTASASNEPLGMFRNTHYYVVFESDYPAEAKTESVLSMTGELLAQVSPKFYKDLLMEGSGKLNDGRVVNWAGRVDGKSRYHITKLTWGRGTGSCALKPFRTIAADPAQIPAGAIVKIAETVGMLLPDGSKHDGIWRAEDTGSAILHDRIDLFIGKKSYNDLLTRGGIGHMEPLTITLLEQPLPDSCVYQEPH